MKYSKELWNTKLNEFKTDTKLNESKTNTKLNESKTNTTTNNEENNNMKNEMVITINADGKVELSTNDFAELIETNNNNVERIDKLGRSNKSLGSQKGHLNTKIKKQNIIIEALVTEIEELKTCQTAEVVYARTGTYLNQSEYAYDVQLSNKLGRAACKYCIDNGIKIINKEVYGYDYDTVKTYPISVLDNVITSLV